MIKQLLPLLMLTVPAPAIAQAMLGSAEVVDGDTFKFGGDTFRIQGIDAPEARQLCVRGVEEWPCGEAATDALKNILARGRLTCRTISRDVYGRAVADCSAGGLNVGKQLLTQGMAISLNNSSAEFRSAEAAAREARVGVWSGDFQRPADFRANNPHLVGPPPKVDERNEYAPLPATRRFHQPVERGPYFRNCAQARAAGYSSMRRGEPGYRAGLDGDNDGIACEPFRRR